MRAVVAEAAIENAGAVGIGQEFAEVADQRTGWGDERQALLAATRRTHVLELAATHADFLDHSAGVVGVDIDGHFFEGLQTVAAVVELVDHARPGNGELEAFPAHVFDQDGEL